MTDQTASNQHRGAAQHCPSCGTAYTPGDRFCSECGTALPAPASGSAVPPTVTPLAAPAPAPAQPAEERNSLWLLAAKPSAVIGGGVLLLLLAALLLFAGQADRTGTIVMLAICLTPLALITLLIGLARGLMGHR